MSAPRAISGRIRLHVVPRDPLAAGPAKQLHELVHAFLEAVRLEMFRGTLGALRGVVGNDQGALDADFDVLDLEPGAFCVLHGMLSHFSLIVAPLSATTAWREPQGSSPNLLTVNAPMPAPPARLPFSVHRDERAGAAPPLVVEVGFGRTLTEPDKDRFDREIRVWVALVHGGYPGGGDPPGSSAIGPLTVRYDDPQTLRLSAEAFLAGEACFASLQALLVRWSADVPVVSLETE